MSVQDELELIRQRHGGVLRPADMVKFAANKRTALHARFCWDDRNAAAQYRLEQARDIIRASVTLVDCPGGDTVLRVRSYVSLRPDRLSGESYRLTTDVMSAPVTRVAILAQAYRELREWRQRYATFAELAKVYDAIDGTTRKAATA